VLEAFDTLFNKRDYVTAERFWAPNYVQHSAHIPPEREGLFSLIKSLPPTLKYENGLILAEGDMLMLHGRFSGIGQPTNWITLDIVRIEDGCLAERILKTLTGHILNVDCGKTANRFPSPFQKEVRYGRFFSV
jgi:predicted SnoaL-like aldol condensation-catalyzing enzyme